MDHAVLKELPCLLANKATILQDIDMDIFKKTKVFLSVIIYPDDCYVLINFYEMLYFF